MPALVRLEDQDHLAALLQLCEDWLPPTAILHRWLQVGTEPDYCQQLARLLIPKPRYQIVFVLMIWAEVGLVGAPLQWAWCWSVGTMYWCPSQSIGTTLYYYLAVVRAVEVFDFSTELQKYWTILVVGGG